MVDIRAVQLELEFRPGRMARKRYVFVGQVLIRSHPEKLQTNTARIWEMKCTDFFRDSLNEKIELASAESELPLVFVHVPKTGGTSLQRDFNFGFPDSVHVPQTNMELSWEQAVGQLESNRVSLVRGHLNHQHLAQLSNKEIDYRPITYLRNPIDRLKSSFLWRKSNFRRAPAQFRDPGRFEDYFRRLPENQICKLLVGETASAEEAIDLISQRFWFVGVTEYYHVCQAVLFAAINKPYRIRQRRNQTRHHQDDWMEVEASDIDALTRWVQRDIAVYDFIHDRWKRKLNEAVEMLMTPRPVSNCRNDSVRKSA